jgi:UDP-glucose 4-epimerase
MKKILVTGGGGFIGSHVVDNLKERGHDVVIFDRVKRGYYREDVEIFLGDTTDASIVDDAVSHSDGVIHLAGILGTQETVDNPLPAIETNIIGGLNVFQAIRRYKKKAVYIAVGNHWMNNPYSISKTTAERFALMFNKEHGTKIAVVRGLNTYGERQKQFPVKKIMPNIIIPAIKNEDITIYGDGTQVMDMIYVKDLAEILSRALLNEHGIYDSVFEAGTGAYTTVNDIANLVIKLAGGGRIKYQEMRPGEEPKAVVVGKPETLAPLGWEGFTPLEIGIKKTIQYYKNEISVKL